MPRRREQPPTPPDPEPIYTVWAYVERGFGPAGEPLFDSIERVTDPTDEAEARGHLAALKEFAATMPTARNSADYCRAMQWDVGTILCGEPLTTDADQTSEIIRLTTLGEAVVRGQRLNAAGTWDPPQEVDLRRRDWTRLFQ